MEYKVRKFQTPSGTLQYFANLNAEAREKNSSPEERVKRAFNIPSKNTPAQTPKLKTTDGGLVMADYVDDTKFDSPVILGTADSVNRMATRGLNYSRTWGLSGIGDVINTISPKAANWVTDNTWGLFPHTTEKDFARHHRSNPNRWNNIENDSGRALESVAIGAVLGAGLSKAGGFLNRGIKNFRFAPQNLVPKNTPTGTVYAPQNWAQRTVSSFGKQPTIRNATSNFTNSSALPNGPTLPAKLRLSSGPVRTARLGLPNGPAIPLRIAQGTSLHIKSTMPGSPLEKRLNKRGEINLNELRQYANHSNTPKSDRYIINKVIDDNFSTDKRVDYNTFKSKVTENLSPLIVKESYVHSNYGVGRLNFENPINNKTYLFSNKEKLGGGSAEHFDDRDNLMHSRLLVTNEEPKVANFIESQSDAFQDKGYMNLLKSMTGESYNPANDPRFENRVFNPNNVDLKQKNFLADNFEERLLQENMQIAAKQGLTRVRYPTMETTASIQGYPSSDKKGKFDRYLAGMDRSRNAVSLDMQSFPMYLTRMSNIYHTPRMVDIRRRLGDIHPALRSDGFADAKSTLHNLETMRDFYEGAERAAYDSEIAQVQKELASINKKRSAAESTLQVLKKELDEIYDSPEFQQSIQNEAKLYDNWTPLDNYGDKYHSILKRAENIGKDIKRVTGKEPTLDTDAKGNTWYGFDIPQSYLNNNPNIKAFSTLGAIGLGGLGANKINK